MFSGDRTCAVPSVSESCCCRSAVARCVVANSGLSVRTLIHSVTRRYIVVATSRAGPAPASCRFLSGLVDFQHCPSRPRQRLLRCATGYSWCFDGVTVCKFLAAFSDHPEFQIFQVGLAQAFLSLSASSLEIYQAFHRNAGCL